MIQVYAHYDHPLGGFRLYRKDMADLWAAEIMDDHETLSQNPLWDLWNWMMNLPDPTTYTYVPAAQLYPLFYRQSQVHHGAWNVCYALQEFLKG